MSADVLTDYVVDRCLDGVAVGVWRGQGDATGTGPARGDRAGPRPGTGRKSLVPRRSRRSNRPMTTSVETPATLTALDRLVGGVADLIDGLGPQMWQAQTPCAEFDVRQMLEHLVGGLQGFERAASGDASGAFRQVSVDPADAPSAYREAGRAAVAVWSEPGRLDATYPMPWGPTTGEQLVGFLVVEQAGHGWDIARAVGRAPQFDATAVAVADRVAQGMVTDAMRVPGMFGPAVAAPDSASPLDRLAAFLGRRP